MTIQQIHLKNFRGFADTQIELGPYTILRGENGAGKSSILMALCWASTGVCRETHLNGSKWERLVSWGAENVGVKVSSDVTTWARSRGHGRGAAAHRLQMAGVDITSVEGVQGILYDRLGASEQILMALFDPLPIMDRDPQTQKVMISRVLKPDPIKVTPLMQKYAIENLASLEQIDKTVKELKEVTLRALNRELKTLQDKEFPKPVWPREGKTAAQLQAGYAQAKATRDELNRTIGGLEQRHQDLTAKLATAAFSEPLTDEDAATLREQVAEFTAKIEQADKQWIEANQALPALDKAVRDASAAMQKNLSDQLKARAALVPKPVECGATECPVLIQFANSDAAKTNAEHEATIERLEGGYKKLDREHKKALKQAEQARAEATELARRLAADKGTLGSCQVRLTAHDAAATSAQATAELEQVTTALAEQGRQLQTAQMIVTKGEKALGEIAQYELAMTQFEAYQENLRTTTAAVREVKQLIEQLISERSRVIDSRIGPITADMNAFLEPFHLGPVRYDLDAGFVADEGEAERWSDGERRQILEAAFRVAAAKATGIGVAVIEHSAPLTKGRERLLGKALMGSGCQIIQVHTTDEKTPPPPGAAWRTWWVERNGTGEARVVELT